MSFKHLSMSIAALSAALLLAPLAAAQEEFQSTLRPFLKQYCLGCHGPTKQQGERRFDQLTLDFSRPQNGELLQEILDQLNLGEMPPEDARQPTVPETRQVVASLTRTLAEARQAARRSAGKVVLRRLNRTEYFNTVRDLFQMNMSDFDPTIAFPADNSVDGFDNIGEGLLTSDFLLAQYLEAAENVLDKAIRPGPRPPLENIVAVGNQIHGGGHDDPRGFKRALVRDQFTRAYVKNKFRGVSEGGQYIFRVRANTVRWKDHRYQPAELGYDPSEPPRIRVLVVNRNLGTVATRTVGEYEIRDNEPVDIEIRGFLQQGYEFAVEWANGPRGSQKRIMRKVFPKYFPEDTVPLARNPVEMYMGSAPELRLHRLELEGPHYAKWPLPGTVRFFGNLPENPAASDLRRSLTLFAAFAYRRPADPLQLEPYLLLAEKRFAETGDFWQAATLAMKGILASPGFIYLVEPQQGQQAVATLDHYELATRLSYFLWSSMPDDELLRVASEGKLRDPGILRQQVNRMLDDPKRVAFSTNFLGQWLNLRKLGTLPPDPASNKAYYSDNLEAAMRQETRLLFDHVLGHNQSILQFIDTNYTFLNPALARHYGIQGVTEEKFQRVTIPPEARRGGLLGHGSILTLTSNGVETQPVSRGVWVLENLLGTPPSPPPPDVQPVEPDTRGVTTIRELMAKHRTIATCNECHRKIDPIGLALENFDYLGRYRTRYNKKTPIDPSGSMPDGTEFTGPSGIRRYLMERPEQFTRCLTEKLMIYALGRQLAITDREDLDQLVKQAAAQGYGFRDLVHQVTQSTPFLSK